MEIILPVTEKSIVEGLIPQKKPFVMVDTLFSWDETELKSAFTVPEEHVFVENGLFQASGVLEHQAQSVALHTGYQYFLKNEEPPVGYIGAIKTFEITHLPEVGMQLETEVKILNEMIGVTLVQISSKVNGKEIATSEMKTVVK